MQALSSETSESKGSPGFFSQVFSELAAPLYEEDEQDFLSEDREPENPSVEDEMGDDDPEDAIYETSNDEDNKPNFAPPRFEKSVTENVNSARTAEEETYFGGATESDADQGKGEDQPKLPNASKEGNVSASLPYSSTLDSANAENKNPELPDEQTGEPDVEIDSRLEEGSTDLDKVQSEQDSALNTKYESSVKQTDDKEIESHQEKEQSNSKKMQFEEDLTVNSVNAKDSKTEPSVKENPAEKEAEIDSAGVNRGKQDPEQEEPRSADSSGGTPFDKKQPHYEDGTKELSDEDLEHLRVKSKPQEQVPSDALEEEEQDQKKNKKEEAEEQEAKERMEEQARKFRLEKAKRDAEEKKKVLEEQSRNPMLEKEKRDAKEKKKAVEDRTRELLLEKEKRIVQEKKKAMAAQARKVRLEKEKKAAEEEKQQKEEEARQLRLESLKKQRQQIEETEKMEMERLRREEEKEISLKKLSVAERKEEGVDDKVPEDEGIDQEKENPTQEKGKTSEDSEDEEHMKIKGAFDQKMAEKEAALKTRLEMLNEERRKFEKMAEEYRVRKKERQQKEQEEKMSTKHSAESELSKAVTAVSPSSKQVKTSHDQGWYMLNVKQGFKRPPPAKKSATLIFEPPACTFRDSNTCRS